MISALQGTTGAVIEPGAGTADFQTLDERMRDAFATGATGAQREYAGLIAMANDSAYLSDPGNLVDLQIRLGEYRHQVELISALARKGVGVAETVLRA